MKTIVLNRTENKETSKTLTNSILHIKKKKKQKTIQRINKEIKLKTVITYSLHSIYCCGYFITSVKLSIK